MPTKQKSTEAVVNEVIEHVLGVSADRIKPSSLLGDDLGADSLDKTDIAILLEENFDVEIPTEDLYKWKSVEDITKSINGKILEAMQAQPVRMVK